MLYGVFLPCWKGRSSTQLTDQQLPKATHSSRGLGGKVPAKFAVVLERFHSQAEEHPGCRAFWSLRGKSFGPEGPPKTSGPRRPKSPKRVKNWSAANGGLRDGGLSKSEDI